MVDNSNYHRPELDKKSDFSLRLVSDLELNKVHLGLNQPCLVSASSSLSNKPDLPLVNELDVASDWPLADYALPKDKAFNSVI